MNVTKFNKQFTIGELDFTISVNRAMAYEAMNKYPQYYQAIMKHEEIIDLVQNQKSKNAKQIADTIASTIDESNIQQAIQLMQTKDTLDIYGEKIVNDCFYKLLEYAETELPEGIASYKDYQEYIFNYCKENEVYNDYQVEEEEVEQGLISLVMEFILMGFTQGNTKNKGKLKIISK